MKTGILMSAEEITGVKGCVSFKLNNGVYYGFGDVGFVGKREELLPFDDRRYDYKVVDSEGDYCYVKKEWLKDIREDVDWSKVKRDDPIIIRVWTPGCVKKRHFAEFKDNKIFYYSDGRTSHTVSNVSNTSARPEDCELSE